MKDYYSQELRNYVEEFLEFDFEKGEIIRKKSRGGQMAGTRAGRVNKEVKGKQYRQIKINGKAYQEHRLLYCFFHKDSFEGFDIDHIDQNSLNNSITNLRHVTKSANQRNAKKRADNSSGVTGVGWNKERQKWTAQIRVDRKAKHLGLFEKKEDAIAARQEAEIKHDFHKNHGK